MDKKETAKPLIYIDSKYEKELYEELLEIAMIMHSGVKGRNVLVRKIPNKNPIMIRKQIRENLDFIRLTAKYMLMDVEATRRERNGLSGEGK